MLLKISFIFLLIVLTLSIRTHHKHHATHDYQEQHDLLNKGKKGRSFEEVCQHYGGAVCDRIAGIGRKCCSKGMFGSKVCDTLGCEHDTVSISDMDWDY